LLIPWQFACLDRGGARIVYEPVPGGRSGLYIVSPVRGWFDPAAVKRQCFSDILVRGRGFISYGIEPPVTVAGPRDIVRAAAGLIHVTYTDGQLAAQLSSRAAAAMPAAVYMAALDEYYRWSEGIPMKHHQALTVCVDADGSELCMTLKFRVRRHKKLMLFKGSVYVPGSHYMFRPGASCYWFRLRPGTSSPPPLPPRRLFSPSL